MRAFLKRSVLGLVISVALSGAAPAEERLVMPFTCQVNGGKVVLVPGQPQSYRIYGTREHRRFTTCSPARPDRCRSWTVHRFDLDCGGVRTSWPNVVAAMASWATPPGRSYRGLGPRYGGPRAYARPPLSPRYARPPRVAGPYARPRPYGARPPALRQMVDLPSGFAPVPARVAHFEMVPVPSAPGPVAQTQSVPLPVQKPTPPVPIEVASAEPSAAPLPAQSSSSSDEAKPSQALATKPADIARSAKSDRLMLTKVANQGTDHAVTSAIPKRQKSKPGFAWLYPVGIAGFWLGALVLLVTAFFLSLRHAKGMNLTVPLRREPAEAGTLFGSTRSGPLDAPSSRPRETASPRPPRTSHSEWLPSTLSEALEVLGAGPETGTDMLKAMVKRLRRTWHPDHAAHEEDRQTRERRLKQINVAWDIIRGKRRARRPSLTSQEC